MITPTDLHPNDTATRNALAGHLRALRVAAGYSQRDVGRRLGVHPSMVGLLERRRVWQVAAVQRWSRVYDHRLTLQIRGLTVPDDGDPLAEMYGQQTPDTVEAEDRLLLRVVVHDLARIRRHRMTAAAMGRRLGRSAQAVEWREDHPDGALLLSVQQTTRALGGHLSVGLVPVGVGAGVSGAAV